MTRVLHVSKTASGGRFIGFQIRHLTAIGAEIHLAVPGPGILADMAREAGAHVHLTPALKTAPLVAARSLAELVVRTRPRVAHTHFVHSTLTTRIARLAAGMALPIFFQVPGPLHLERSWSREFEIRTAARHDHWGPACQWSFDRYLRSGVPARRVHLAYYGKDLGAYVPDRASRADARRELAAHPDVYLAVMVAHVYRPRRGRRRGIKGHEDFIRAIGIAQRQLPKLKGLIVGGPRPGAERYYRELQARVAHSGTNIEFLGPRSDIQRIYQAADLAIHPSLSENLGGAGESLLMEVPTITTNVGGFRDIVRPGLSGLMVAPRKPTDLAEAILRAADSPRHMHNMAQAGRGMVEQVGNAAVNAARVADIYREML